MMSATADANLGVKTPTLGKSAEQFLMCSLE
jgi:hypothetical protein